MVAPGPIDSLQELGHNTPPGRGPISSTVPTKFSHTEANEATQSEDERDTRDTHFWLQFVGGPQMPYDPSYHLLYRAEPVARAVRELRPDVFEVHSPYAAALIADRIPRGDYGIRTFLWHSDFIDTYERVLLGRFPSSVRKAATAPLWAWARHIAKRSEAVFVATKHLQSSLSAHGLGNLVLLPFGVDKETFRPSPERAMEMASGTAPKRLVTIGRLAIEKRVDVVLDAFRRMARTRKDLELWVVGDGPERKRLEASAKDLPQVRFVGFEKDRKKLAATLRESVALLHACPYETFGLGVAEALACGVPAVLPDEGGASEWGASHSRLLHRSLDAEDLARAGSELLSRIEAAPLAVRADAAGFAKSILSVEDHFDRLLDHYEALLGRAAARVGNA